MGLLGIALLFLIIAIVAYVVGAGQAGGLALEIAKWCGIVFVVLLLINLIFGFVSPGPYWGWPSHRAY
jgi:uncharacterized membrane protein YtjA (UPF0391 family)